MSNSTIRNQIDHVKEMLLRLKFTNLSAWNDKLIIISYHIQKVTNKCIPKSPGISNPLLNRTVILHTDLPSIYSIDKKRSARKLNYEVLK